MSKNQIATLVTEVAVPVNQIAKSVAQRAARKRFSFGPTWNAAVIGGTATDQAKMIEHALKLKLGVKSDLRKLKLVTLRAKIAGKLQAQSTIPVVEGAVTLDAKVPTLSS
jgi:hypothetical protein